MNVVPATHVSIVYLLFVLVKLVNVVKLKLVNVVPATLCFVLTFCTSKASKRITCARLVAASTARSSRSAFLY